MFPILIQIDHETAERIRKPIIGVGGFQDLLKLLQDHLKGQALEIPGLDVGRRIVRYARQYGRGGFEGRLEKIADEIEERTK